MTMHLIKGVSSLKSSKPQPVKLTKAKRADLEEQLRMLNKNLKQQGRHSERMTFDEYVDYLHGKAKKTPKKATKRSRPATSSELKPYRRETKDIPSLDNRTSVAAKKEPKRYTGTLVKGVSQMHKSNAVPVIDDEHIKDIARMRR